MLKILCYKNQGIHWYPCHPTFLWKINFTLVWRLISALIWDISGKWNHSDSRDFREKRIVFLRFLMPYISIESVIVSNKIGMFINWIRPFFWVLTGNLQNTVKKNFKISYKTNISIETLRSFYIFSLVGKWPFFHLPNIIGK